MMLGTQTVTLLRAGVSPGEDAHGNPLPATPSEILLTGCSVQPGSGREVFGIRDQVTTVYTVWAPLDPAASDLDQVRFGGTVYDLDGPVERWEVGTPLDHQVLHLKRVEG